MPDGFTVTHLRVDRLPPAKMQVEFFVDVELSTAVRFRLWLAKWCIVAAGWLMNANINFVIEENENDPTNEPTPNP